MPLPRWVARLNLRLTNRFIEPVVRRRPGFAVVHHRGRHSGERYATPVYLFDMNGRHVVVLTYGPRADWIQNLLASPGELERDGRLSVIRSVEIVDRAMVGPALPLPVRLATRVLQIRHLARLATTAGGHGD